MSLEQFSELNKKRRMFVRMSKKLHAMHQISFDAGFWRIKDKESAAAEVAQCQQEIASLEEKLNLKPTGLFDANLPSPVSATEALTHLLALDAMRDWFVANLSQLRSTGIDRESECICQEDFDINENEVIAGIIQIEDRIRFYESQLENVEYHRLLKRKSDRAIGNFACSETFDPRDRKVMLAYNILVQQRVHLDKIVVDGSIVCRLSMERMMRRHEAGNSVLDSSAYIRNTSTVKRCPCDMMLSRCA